MKSRRDKKTLLLKEVVKKFSNVRIRSHANEFEGAILIKNVRLYDTDYHTEVDIQFSGKFRASYRGKKVSISKDDLPSYSKIWVNRYLRRIVFPFIKTHLSYFDIKISGYWNIKKIKWV